MLSKLKIKNFALISEMELDFNNGFSVITGETGAGKSIFIDAVSYVMGTKFNREFIRTGEDKTSVEAIFDCPPGVTQYLMDEGLSLGNGSQIIIQRENAVTGKAIAKINGELVPVNKVKEIYPLLLDIHGQHNNQNLLNPENHLAYLDSYANLSDSPEYRKYTRLYRELKNRELKLSGLTRNNEREKIIDFLAYQIKEIKDMRVSEEEEETLLEKEKMLSNSQKIADALNYAREALDDEGLSTIASAFKGMRGISEVLKPAGPLADIMEEAYYNLDETRMAIADLLEDIYFDQNELDDINSRLFAYGNLKKKYGGTVGEIQKKLSDMENELWELENAETLIKKLKHEMRGITGDLITEGEAIHSLRNQAAKDLSQKINRELKFIGLGKADFAPYVLKGESVLESGLDSVHFMISTNTGEPKKPLEKIVSGGELSRIMLAMKAAFLDKDHTPTVIFDEIDIGISGRIAAAVGQKMYSIASATQVLSVTHLPQITSWADNHYIASKWEADGRTYSRIRLADPDERIAEIAGMIGGANVTESSFINAAEMISNVNKLKAELKPW